jgi:hypothetical protein
MKYLLCVVLVSASTAVFSGDSGYPETMAGDTRQVQTKSSPKWLNAVGQSVSQLRNGNYESCSLSLVADSPAKDGIIVIGAGHCVDHLYNIDGGFDISDYPITFMTKSGKKIERQLVAIFKASVAPGDYFIGKLNSYIPRSEIDPLINAPFDYTDMLSFPFNPVAYAVGYSADTGIGQKGKVLTYDKCKQINGGQRGRKMAYCYSYEGASGGAMAITLDFSKIVIGRNPYCKSCKNEWEGMEGELFEDFFQYSIPELEPKEYAFWFGNLYGGRRADDHDRTVWVSNTFHTKLLDKILAKY